MPDSPDDSNHLRILIADDDPMSRRLLVRAMLSSITK